MPDSDSLLQIKEPIPLAFGGLSGALCCPEAVGFSGQINLSFGFDDEEGVGVGAAGGAEFLPSVFERGGKDRENHFSLCAADEVEASFLLNELELRRHS